MCLDYVVRSGRPGIITPYIRALKSRDNELINRAGAALGQIGDRDAIGPLIDALVTKHKVQITEGASGDQHAYTFGEGGGFTLRQQGAQIREPLRAKSAPCSTALVALAGTSFDYDQPQWRTWLAAQAKLNAVDDSPAISDYFTTARARGLPNSAGRWSAARAASTRPGPVRRCARARIACTASWPPSS